MANAMETGTTNFEITYYLYVLYSWSMCRCGVSDVGCEVRGGKPPRIQEASTLEVPYAALSYRKRKNRVLFGATDLLLLVHPLHAILGPGGLES